MPPPSSRVAPEAGEQSLGAPTPRTERYGPPNCRAPNTLTPQEAERCRWAMASSPHHADAQTPYPGTGDEDRNSVFAREAAAKKRWRDYYAGDGPYPGLLSLLGKNR